MRDDGNDDGQGEDKRRRLCEDECNAVDRLIEEELGANVVQLQAMVDTLCAQSHAGVTLLGCRLAGAFVQSYMGATTDRQVGGLGICL